MRLPDYVNQQGGGPKETVCMAYFYGMMTDFPARAIVKINRIKKGLSGVVETSKDREGRVNKSILQDIGY